MTQNAAEIKLRVDYSVQMFGDWLDKLKEVINSKNFENLGHKIYAVAKYKIILPSTDPRVIFRAFTETQFADVKIVILGQDPYNTMGFPDGLAFSCSKSKYPAPSLKNILGEVDIQIYSGKKDIFRPEFYDLQRWAEQGILLLNTALTVEEGLPNSHKDWWQFFTEAVINALQEKKNLIYMLWGKEAQKFKFLIDDRENNLILECGHPVTKTYKRDSWSNNEHFIKANEYLKSLNKEEIIW